VIDPAAPWIAVVIPDHDLTQKKEATGTFQKGKS
jgi:hypothetical protein